MLGINTYKIHRSFKKEKQHFLLVKKNLQLLKACKNTIGGAYWDKMRRNEVKLG